MRLLVFTAAACLVSAGSMPNATTKDPCSVLAQKIDDSACASALEQLSPEACLGLLDASGNDQSHCGPPSEGVHKLDGHTDTLERVPSGGQHAPLPSAGLAIKVSHERLARVCHAVAQRFRWPAVGAHAHAHAGNASSGSTERQEGLCLDAEES